VGLLVDNSVVVIENIYRHIEEGADRFTAAVKGTKEVALAISASTFTTIAVFLPMVFSTGMVSILVRGLALTVSFSLLVSLVIALTIVPTLATIMFNKNNTMMQKIAWFEWFRDKYMIILNWCLHHRVKTVLMVIFSILISALLLTRAGAEFIPSGDQPFILMSVKMPKGTVLEETNAIVSQIETILAKTEGVETFLVMVGAPDDAQAQGDGQSPADQSEATIFIRVVDEKLRNVTSQEIMQDLRSKIPRVQDGDVSFQTNMMSADQTSPVELKLFGNDLEQLTSLSREITRIMAGIPEIIDIQNTMQIGSPEIHFSVNRDKAMQYALTPLQISNAMRTATTGSVIGVFRDKGDEIDIRLQYKPEQRQTIDDINEIRINSPLGISLPLNTLVTQKYGTGQSRINREGQVRKATITANIHGSDLAKVTRNLQTRLDPFVKSLPMGYNLEFGGSYKEMREGFVTLSLAFLLSMVLVYIVMACQFESMKQPFIIMFTVPLCFIGVSLALFISGQTVSVISFVGLIILCGIITNNGIVLIDYVNQLRENGVEKHEAILKAGHDRIRPVLITSLSTVIAMIPLAFSSGQGSEMKTPLAVTIIGGLLSATFMTLVVIPVIYSLVDRIRFKDS
jgi:HAE1 family hydrophobic/amphiphilic exporter-1